MLRIGFIGAGRVAEVHHLALASLPHLQLVGVQDHDPAVARRRGDAWGVPVFTDIESMLADPQIDAVLVLTPVETHVEIATRAIDAGKHVFIEKPIDSDPAAIRALAARASAAGLVAMPGHNYAYLPGFPRAAELTHGGQLGEIRAVFLNYVIRHPEEVARDYIGVLEEVMVHHTYLSLALLGAPQRIVASRAETGWVSHPEEDQAWMVFDYGKASVHSFATFAVGDHSSTPWTFNVKVLGTEGTATAEFGATAFQRPLGTLPLAYVAYEDSYIAELDAFAKAVESGAPLVSTMEDAALAAGILQAAHESADTAAFVTRTANGKSRW